MPTMCRAGSLVRQFERFDRVERADTVKSVSVEEAIEMLKLSGSKLFAYGTEWVRLLDFFEKNECDPGTMVAIQVLDYTDGEYIDVNVGRGLEFHETDRFIRQNLNYVGPIGLAVAKPSSTIPKLTEKPTPASPLLSGLPQSPTLVGTKLI